MPRSTHPVHRFHQWFRAAERAGAPQPEAMALATVDAAGQPTVRWVLLKQVDESGFTFFTDKESRKGKALAECPRAAAAFYWNATRRSVRIEGRVVEVDEDASDAYWATRPRGSRLSAVASHQSATLDSRRTLVARRARLAREVGKGTVPRPDRWGGFLIIPDRIEFWEERESRLHHREVFTRSRSGWSRRLLQP